MVILSKRYNSEVWKMANVTNWMGRYRSLIHALIRYSNSFARIASQKINWGEGIELSAWEWQLLEHIIENDSQCENMLSIANSLGIAQSTISKYTKSLIRYGLVEKYQYKNNKKNIVLRATEKGFKLYETGVANDMYQHFEFLFTLLENIPDEVLDQFTHAIDAYSDKRIFTDDNDELIKL